MPQPCDLCHSDLSRLLFRKGPYPILQCQACGLVRTDLPPGFDLSSIYDTSYFTGGQNDGYADYPGSETVIKAEFSRTLARIRSFLPDQPKRRRLLDIGCAYGFMLDMAAPEFDVCGIEVSPEAVKACRQRGHEVAEGLLTPAALAQTGEKADIVTLLDTIEHLPSPSASLRLIHDHMQPGGLLCITTGDIGSLYARISGSHWRLMTPPQHTFFFSRSTITRLLSEAGFEVVHISSPFKLVPLGLAAYQVGARLGWRIPLLEKIRIGIPVNLFDAMQIIARKR